ncbi:MAG: SpoIIE family protein phosphatase [Lentisphaeria bacterium]|nr:SpoIIE family protein phosphatase [Lentisphaeria bacterium]
MTNQTYNVLAVDDEKFSLVLLQSCLRNENYNLTTCDNALQAVKEFKTHDFDVILLDVMLGSIDGFEVRKLIREYNQKIPIIFLTSLLDDINSSLINRISDDQYSYYLNKSFQKKQLMEKIEHAVRVYREESDAARFYKQLNVDLLLAREVQRVLLPPWCSLNKHMLTTYLYEPCFRISGDSLDLVELGSGKYLLFLADIAGHGIQSALYMSAIQSFLKALRLEMVEQAWLPNVILNRINQFFCNDLSGGSYMTCLVAIFDYPNQRLVFQSAGHPGLICCSRREQRAYEIDMGDKGGVPVGWFARTVYQEEDNVYYDLDASDIILGYTDGLIDLKNDREETVATPLLLSLLTSLMEKSTFLPLPYLLRSALDQIGYNIVPDDVCIVEVRGVPKGDDNILQLINLSKGDVSRGVEHFWRFVEERTHDNELATRVELLLSEYLNNVIEYECANRPGLRSGILVQICLREPDTVFVTVLDREPKSDQDKLQLARDAADVFEQQNQAMASSGRGLAIIRTISSNIMRKHYNGLNQTEFLIRSAQPWSVQS